MPTILWIHYIWRPFLLLAQLLVIVYPGVLIFWLIMHTNISRWRRVGKRAYWIAAIGWPVTALPMILFWNQVFSAQFPAHPLMVTLGVLAIVVSVLLARKAGGAIPLRTLVGLPELEPGNNPQPLLSSGIYARTRNPVYLAHWLFIVGAAAISGYVANWILFSVDCVLLPMVIRAEERELRSRYGAGFEDYMSRVPRFFPKWT